MFSAISIELVLAIVGIFTLILEMVGGQDRRMVAWIALAGLALAAVVGIGTEWPLAAGDQHSFFGGSLIVDRMAVYFKFVALLVTFISILIAIPYVDQESRYPAEFYSLV